MLFAASEPARADDLPVRPAPCQAGGAPPSQGASAVLAQLDAGPDALHGSDLERAVKGAFDAATPAERSGLAEALAQRLADGMGRAHTDNGAKAVEILLQQERLEAILRGIRGSQEGSRGAVAILRDAQAQAYANTTGMTAAHWETVSVLIDNVMASRDPVAAARLAGFTVAAETVQSKQTRLAAFDAGQPKQGLALTKPLEAGPSLSIRLNPDARVATFALDVPGHEPVVLDRAGFPSTDYLAGAPFHMDSAPQLDAIRGATRDAWRNAKADFEYHTTNRLIDAVKSPEHFHYLNQERRPQNDPTLYWGNLVLEPARTTAGPVSALPHVNYFAGQAHQYAMDPAATAKLAPTTQLLFKELLELPHYAYRANEVRLSLHDDAFVAEHPDRGPSERVATGRIQGLLAEILRLHGPEEAARAAAGVTQFVHDRASPYSGEQFLRTLAPLEFGETGQLAMRRAYTVRARVAETGMGPQAWAEVATQIEKIMSAPDPIQRATSSGYRLAQSELQSFETGRYHIEVQLTRAIPATNQTLVFRMNSGFHPLQKAIGAPRWAEGARIMVVDSVAFERVEGRMLRGLVGVAHVNGRSLTDYSVDRNGLPIPAGRSTVQPMTPEQIKAMRPWTTGVAKVVHTANHADLDTKTYRTQVTGEIANLVERLNARAEAKQAIGESGEGLRAAARQLESGAVRTAPTVGETVGAELKGGGIALGSAVLTKVVTYESGSPALGTGAGLSVTAGATYALYGAKGLVTGGAGMLVTAAGGYAGKQVGGDTGGSVGSMGAAGAFGAYVGSAGGPVGAAIGAGAGVIVVGTVEVTDALIDQHYAKQFGRALDKHRAKMQTVRAYAHVLGRLPSEAELAKAMKLFAPGTKPPSPEDQRRRLADTDEASALVDKVYRTHTGDAPSAEAQRDWKGAVVLGAAAHDLEIALVDTLAGIGRFTPRPGAPRSYLNLEKHENRLAAEWLGAPPKSDHSAAPTEAFVDPNLVDESGTVHAITLLVKPAGAREGFVARHPFAGTADGTIYVLVEKDGGLVLVAKRSGRSVELGPVSADGRVPALDRLLRDGPTFDPFR